MNHVGIEAAANDFNGNRALSSLDAEGCTEERMFRLVACQNLLQQTKDDILKKKEPNNRNGGCFLKGSSYCGITFQEIISGSFSNL